MLPSQEKRIRRWLRKSWNDRLDWIEAARGGTPGLPDVNIWDGEVCYPTELKWGKLLRRDLKFRVKLRPAQIRYQRLAFKEGRKTMILVGTNESNLGGDRGGEHPPFCVWAIPNRMVTDSGISGRFELGIAHCACKLGEHPHQRLLQLIRSKEFWEGN